MQRIGFNSWVNAAFNNLKEISHRCKIEQIPSIVYCTDLRFPHEYEALKNFDDYEIEDFYTFARNKVNKKSAFASSLLYFEDEENTWKVPKYISEGLLWLRKQ